MKTKIIFILTLFFLSAYLVNGQAGLANPEDIGKIKERTFLIMLEEPKKELMAKLKPEEQEKYTADINSYNEMMKTLMPKVWTLSSKIDFKTRSEIMELINARDPNYTYLEYEKYRVQLGSVGGFRSTFQSDAKRDLLNVVNPGGAIAETNLSIRPTDKAATSLEIISVRMPSVFPTKGEMANAVKEILYTFDKRMAGMKTMQLATQPKREAKRLATMKLLINSDDLNATEEQIKKVYPYPYEIVKGKEQQDLAILSNDTSYAVIKVIPLGNKSYAYRVFAASDGTLLASSNNSQSTGVSVGGIGVIDDARAMEAHKIKDDHLKLIGNQVRDSIKYEK
jgi:hypothetical protein